MSAVLSYLPSNNTASVPDGASPSLDNLLLSPSLYDFDSFSPTSSTLLRKDPDLTELLQDSSYGGLTGGPFGSPTTSCGWDATPSPLSSTATSPPVSNYLSFPNPSLVTSPPTPSLPPKTEGYMDLSLFCEGGFTSTTDNKLSVFSPSSVDHAPLSPEEQEIQDIMTSLQEPPVYEPYIPCTTSPLASPVGDDTDTLSQYLSPNYSPVNSTTVPSPPPSSIPLTPPSVPLASPSLPLTSSPAVVGRSTIKIHDYNVKDSCTSGTKKRRKMTVAKKKERKKEQNKTAALRYRQKKREESRVIEEKQDLLEEKNRLLKRQVVSLEGEIRYLKQLWTEIAQHRQTLHRH